MLDDIESFIKYLKDVKKASENTQIAYRRDLLQMQAYLESQGICQMDKVTRTSLDSYLLYLEREGKATTTISRVLATVKAFFHYGYRMGIITQDPAELVKAPKVQKKMPRILSVEEIDALLSQPSRRNAKEIRDKAMLELLYATGIRASELINLDVNDINLRSGVLYCRGNKGVRSIPVYPSAIVAVSDYIYRMRSLIIGPDGGDALFVNLNGGRLTRQGFWKIVKSYATEAGITKEITPHTIRHSFALHLLENGASVKDIQTMMGHADISSTQVYVQLLDNHVRQVYQDCHPKAKLG